jgi:hypothetical protein
MKQNRKTARIKVVRAAAKKIRRNKVRQKKLELRMV